MLHLLAGEDRRFKECPTEVKKSHARYANRYAFQELGALVANFPVITDWGQNNMQETASRPLYRHFVRELIVRGHATNGGEQFSAPVDWEAVLSEVMTQLEHDLNYGANPVEFTGGGDGGMDNDAWLPPARSVGSNYDRKDDAHIRRVIEHAAYPVPDASEITKIERKRREEFRDRLRLRFAYTAYTHIVRGILNRIIERERLSAVREHLHSALEICRRTGLAEHERLNGIANLLNEAIEACAIPFASLVLRRLD
ncbi:MAG: hypothetical protein ACRERS_11250, partial [Methylococcales bacterium]